jgi:hypothetical protein
MVPMITMVTVLVMMKMIHFEMGVTGAATVVIPKLLFLLTGSKMRTNWIFLQLLF